MSNNLENTIINKETLITFVAVYAYEYIGRDQEGSATTLSDEMATVAKMVSRADVCRIAVDPYRHSRLAYAMAEMNDDQKLAQIVNNYRRAGTKIFWLNSICRSFMGKTFIAKKLDPHSMSDVEKLVDEFQATIRLTAAESYVEE